MVAQPFPGKQVKTEGAEVKHIKQITGIADGQEDQQIEQAHGDDGAKIEAVEKRKPVVMGVEGCRCHQRGWQLDHVIALGAKQQVMLTVRGQCQRCHQVVVGQFSAMEGHPVTHAGVLDLVAVLVKNVDVQVIQMGAPHTQKPVGQRAVVFHGDEEPLKPVAKPQGRIWRVQLLPLAGEQGL